MNSCFIMLISEQSFRYFCKTNRIEKKSTMANNITQVKCACPSCSCTVDISDAIEKDGQYFCCESCSTGHKQGGKCINSGCGCHA